MNLVEVVIAFTLFGYLTTALVNIRHEVRQEDQARQIAAWVDGVDDALADYLRDEFTDLAHCLDLRGVASGWAAGSYSGGAAGPWTWVPVLDPAHADTGRTDAHRARSRLPCPNQQPFIGTWSAHGPGTRPAPALPGRSLVSATSDAATPADLVYPRSLARAGELPVALGGALTHRSGDEGLFVGRQPLRVRMAVRVVDRAAARTSGGATPDPALQAVLVAGGPTDALLDAAFARRILGAVHAPGAAILSTPDFPYREDFGVLSTAVGAGVRRIGPVLEGRSWAMPLCIDGSTVAAGVHTGAWTPTGTPLPRCPDHDTGPATDWPDDAQAERHFLALGAPFARPTTRQDGQALTVAVSRFGEAQSFAPFTHDTGQRSGTTWTRWLTGQDSLDEVPTVLALVRLSDPDLALQDVLYRKDIGDAAANTMETELHMGGHGIDGLEWLLSAATGGLPAGGDASGVLDVHGPVHFHDRVQVGGTAFVLADSAGSAGDLLVQGRLGVGLTGGAATTDFLANATDGDVAIQGRLQVLDGLFAYGDRHLLVSRTTPPRATLPLYSELARGRTGAGAERLVGALFEEPGGVAATLVGGAAGVGGRVARRGGVLLLPAGASGDPAGAIGNLDWGQVGVHPAGNASAGVRSAVRLEHMLPRLALRGRWDATGADGTGLGGRGAPDARTTSAQTLCPPWAQTSAGRAMASGRHLAVPAGAGDPTPPAGSTWGQPGQQAYITFVDDVGIDPDDGHPRLDVQRKRVRLTIAGRRPYWQVRTSDGVLSQHLVSVDAGGTATEQWTRAGVAGSVLDLCDYSVLFAQ